MEYRPIVIEKGNLNLPHPLAIHNDLQFLGSILDTDLLLQAYRFGFFPWYEIIGDLSAFYHPQTRYILNPCEVKTPKSMNTYFNNAKYYITIDQEFGTVIRNCSRVPRGENNSSWISSNFVKSYTTLHQLGYAHSVEVWNSVDHTLVGGLYGLSFGKIFHGESMFSLLPNASRFGLISLSRILCQKEFFMIDCQVENPYLVTFGGKEIPKAEFFDSIKLNLLQPTIVGNWGDFLT